MNPQNIEQESFRIIAEQMRFLEVPEEEMRVRMRIAHATADIEFAANCLFHPDAVRAGVDAIRGGCTITTDVEMVRAGIRRNAAERFGGEVRCFLYEDGVAEEATREGTTRSVTAIRRATSVMEGGIVAIGNAPTALFELCRIIEGHRAKPALVVGIPVGFVGAAESKEACARLAVPYITNRGRRGGSAVAASAVNALLALAAEDRL